MKIFFMAVDKGTYTTSSWSCPLTSGPFSARIPTTSNKTPLMRNFSPTPAPAYSLSATVFPTTATRRAAASSSSPKNSPWRTASPRNFAIVGGAPTTVVLAVSASAFNESLRAWAPTTCVNPGTCSRSAAASAGVKVVTMAAASFFMALGAFTAETMTRLVPMLSMCRMTSRRLPSPMANRAITAAAPIAIPIIAIAERQR